MANAAVARHVNGGTRLFTMADLASYYLELEGLADIDAISAGGVGVKFCRFYAGIVKINASKNKQEHYRIYGTESSTLSALAFVVTLTEDLIQQYRLKKSIARVGDLFCPSLCVCAGLKGQKRQEALSKLAIFIRDKNPYGRFIIRFSSANLPGVKNAKVELPKFEGSGWKVEKEDGEWGTVLVYDLDPSENAKK